MLTIGPVIALALVGTINIDLESSVATRADLEKAELILRGMVDSRERLRTGVFRGNGASHVEASTGRPEIGGPVTIFGAFDNSGGLFRFDVSCFIDVGGRNGEIRSRFVRTPANAMMWRDYDPHRLIVDTVDAKPTDMPIIFDVRALGLTGAGGLRGTSMGTFQGACEALVDNVEVIRVEESEQSTRIDVRSRAHKSIGASLWFDLRRGYSVIRKESWLGDSYRNVMELSWISMSDTWVPQSLVSQAYRDGELEDRLELAFSWESVNEAVKESLFGKEGLGLSGDTEVVSRELGETEIVLGTIAGTTPSLGEPLNDRNSTIVRWSVGIIALTLIVSLMTLRRCRRHTKVD